MNDKRENMILQPIVSDEKNYIEDIEAFRGLAALLVFYFHANMQHINYNNYLDRVSNYDSIFLSLFFEGHVGVSLFFVISGFLLSMKWVIGKDVSLSKFFKNRAIRILPLYYISIIYYIYIIRPKVNITEILPYFLFLQNTVISKANLGNAAGVYWSLVPEVHFYIILPFLMTYFKKKRYLIGLIFISVFLKYSVPMVSSSIFGRIDQFLIGVFCADIYFNRLKNKNLNKNILWIILIGNLFLLLYLLKFLSSTGGYLSLREPGYLLISFRTLIALIWGVIIVTFLTIESRLKKIFVNKFTKFIGMCSYSNYIWHYLIIMYFKKNKVFIHYFKNLFVDNINLEFLMYTTIIILPVVLVVSYISYIYIERPFLLIKKTIK